MTKNYRPSDLETTSRIGRTVIPTPRAPESVFNGWGVRF